MDHKHVLENSSSAAIDTLLLVISDLQPLFRPLRMQQLLKVI